MILFLSCSIEIFQMIKYLVIVWYKNNTYLSLYQKQGFEGVL